jgi:exopolysaccharide biosynthesis predicted pyruvyltransferase EpsI
MAVEKISVPDFLKSVAAGQTIDWVLNPGNAGDSLIVAGTVQLMSDHGISYRCINEYDRYDSTGRIMCYSGGGCLVPYYTFGRDFLMRHHERAQHIVLLPHTVDGNEDLLAAFGSNVTLICREEISYQYCRRASRAQVYAADDLAFSLAAKQFLTQPQNALSLRDEKISARLLSRYREFLAHAGGENTLAAWREDVEQNVKRPMAASHDIANVFGIESTYGLGAMLTSAEYFLRTVDHFATIRTDRLHVAVAGVLLGKRVEIYPNSYFKNRAMYEFSLTRYPGARFVEWSAPDTG